MSGTSSGPRPHDGAEGGYDFSALAAAEESHFWFKHRPAHKTLWSYFDELFQHYRDLSRSLASAGFRVEFRSELMAAFPAMWASRRLAQLMGRGEGQSNAESGTASHEPRVVPGVSAAFNQLTRTEAWWIGRMPLLAVARAS
jgi:hypothetical protein